MSYVSLNKVILKWINKELFISFKKAQLYVKDLKYVNKFSGTPPIKRSSPLGCGYAFIKPYSFYQFLFRTLAPEAQPSCYAEPWGIWWGPWPSAPAELPAESQHQLKAHPPSPSQAAPPSWCHIERRANPNKPYTNCSCEKISTCHYSKPLSFEWFGTQQWITRTPYVLKRLKTASSPLLNADTFFWSECFTNIEISYSKSHTSTDEQLRELWKLPSYPQR